MNRSQFLQRLGLGLLAGPAALKSLLKPVPAALKLQTRVLMGTPSEHRVKVAITVNRDCLVSCLVVNDKWTYRSDKTVRQQIIGSRKPDVHMQAGNVFEVTVDRPQFGDRRSLSVTAWLADESLVSTNEVVSIPAASFSFPSVDDSHTFDLGYDTTNRFRDLYL